MVVLHRAPLAATAHGLLATVEVRGVEEARHLEKTGMGDRVEEVSWVAEEGVDLEVEEGISEETGPYLQESGGEAKDCQSPDTAATEAVEVEAEVPTDPIAVHIQAMRGVHQHPTTRHYGLRSIDSRNLY